MIVRSTPNWPRFLWHHRVHTEKRGERLSYWRIAFGAGYERDRVAAGIEAACAQCHVKGVIVYELFGADDLLIRAWLPRERKFEEFEAAITEELASAGLKSCYPFAVDCMVRHWPFRGASGKPEAPEENAVSHLQDSEIHDVEAKWPDIEPTLYERLLDERLLAPIAESSEAPGVKFAIEVSSNADSDVRTLAEFERQLVELLDAATNIRQCSLYSGAGFAHFLIMGRVDYEEFHAIHSELISKINTGALAERFSPTTLTHISGQRGYRIAREGLSGDGDVSRAHKVSAFLQRRLTSQPDPERVLSPGEDFGGRFEILEHLGGGGFANVYAAHDQLEDVKRALKIFKSTNREVALREMAALRRINHPNVVKAIWGDHEGPLWYLVTEFVEGRSLDEFERGDDVFALSIVSQTLEALQAVHPDDQRIEELRSHGELSKHELEELQSLKNRGLIHRDIKPENIMVGDDGHVTLVDFNIASPARELGKTRSGTIDYMAPDAGLDGWEPSDDLFACGVVLYELLLGEHPFPKRQAVLGMAPIDPLTVRPDLPDSLVNVLLRGCSSIRTERYQTAADMRSAIEAQCAALESLESAARLAWWQFQRQKTRSQGKSPSYQHPAVRPAMGVPPSTTEGSVQFARILMARIDESPYTVDGEQSGEASDGHGSGGSDRVPPDEDDDRTPPPDDDDDENVEEDDSESDGRRPAA